MRTIQYLKRNKLLRRLLSWLVALCLVIQPVTAYAAKKQFPLTSGYGVSWQFDRDTGTLYGTDCSYCKQTALPSRTLQIPNYIDGTAVTRISAWESTGAYCNCGSSSDPHAGSYPFAYQWPNVLELPSTITELDESAFALRTVSHPNSLHHDLWKVTLSPNIANIPSRLFDNQRKLTEVQIKEGTRSIGDAAFNNCTAMPNITLPESITSIASNAFAGCTSLNTITVIKPKDSIAGAPWGAADGTTVVWAPRDNTPPTITKVDLSTAWNTTSTATVEATDMSGVVSYAITNSVSTPSNGSWQSSNSFTLSSNGTYYAWARDAIGNTTVGYSFTVSKVDKLPPAISSIAYSADNSTIMIRGKDNESGVKGIYIDDIPYLGSTVSWDVPSGTRYIRLQVEDMAGNKSKEEKHRVRGWFDVLDSITIEPVEFTDDNKKALITSTTTDVNEIVGIYVNGRLQSGNPITYRVSAGAEYLELQAEDINGDRSELYRVRVPGWSQELNTLSIVDVRFAEGNGSATVTAMSTGGVEVRGIRVNGELIAGNPVVYEIPTGTTHLKLQAEDMNGDRSAVLIRRIPGWSEVVTTIAITDITFTDYNTTAQITATATGGDSVAGIIVNEKRYEGNPIIYTVPKDTQTLHIQAYNPQGDKSPMVNKAVPMDSSKSTLKLSIEHPDWTKGRSARVKISVADKNRITKILVRTGEDTEWAEVTEKRYIDITADTTVYATVENDRGESKEISRDIECFDRTAPTVTATQDGKTVNIRATDNKSGVTSILVNNKEYQRGDFEDGKLAYRIPEGTTMVIVKAEDAAGNLSRAVELPIQNTVTALPVIIAPTPTPAPTPELPTEEAAIPATKPSLPTQEPKKLELEAPVTDTTAKPQEPMPPVAQAAVAAGSLGSTAAGGIWYWLRRMKLNKPIEELELLGKKLLYDESAFGGSTDPLDKLNQGGQEDV